VASAFPWFPFYVSDWETDEAVKTMSFEARGAYLTMLCHQWANGSIPLGELELRSLLPGCANDTILRVRAKFDPLPEQPLRGVNHRLQELRDESLRISKLRAKAGRKGGAVTGFRRRSNSQASDKQKPSYPQSHPALIEQERKSQPHRPRLVAEVLNQHEAMP